MMTGSQYFPVNPPFNSRRALYVDPLAGPFFTLTQAKNAAQSGDCIVVMPGTYAENNLLKNGVNWFFMPGAVVNFTATAASAHASGTNDNTVIYGIFDDRSPGAVTCVIGGHGSFFVTSRGYPNLLGTLVVNNANSNIQFHAKEIGFQIYYDFGVTALGSRAAVHVENGVRVDVVCDRIYSTRGTTYDTGFFDGSDEIIWNGNGAGVYWKLGNLYVKCQSIESVDAYSVWGDQPAGNATAAGMYIEADVIEQHIYMDGGATGGGLTGTYNWKSWIIAKEIKDGIAYFDYGKHYLNAQKIDCTSSTMSFNGAVQVWMTVQKISNNGATGWIISGAGNPSGTGCPVVFADVQHFEDVQGIFSGTGIDIVGATTEFHLRGAFVQTKAGNTAPAIRHQSGSSRISGFTIDTSATNNANSNPILVSGAGCIVDKCVLKSTTAACVNAAAAQTIKAYAVKANVAKSANVTVQVDAITVDANVA